MIVHGTGDLITVGEKGRVNVIVHQANLFHTFGAGIAKSIRERLPYAYEADLKTPYGDQSKLGTFSIGAPAVGQIGPVVVNMYSQIGMYPSHTSYDAMFEALTELRDLMEGRSEVQSIGFPYKIGCGLADGNWSVVEAIIKAVFEGSRFEIVIVKLPGTE